MTRDDFYAWLVHGIKANTGFGNQGAMSEEDARFRRAAEHVAAELAPLAADPFVLFLMRDPLVRDAANVAYGDMVDDVAHSMIEERCPAGFVRPRPRIADRSAMFLPARFVERLMSAIDPDAEMIAEARRVDRIIGGGA